MLKQQQRGELSTRTPPSSFHCFSADILNPYLASREVASGLRKNSKNLSPASCCLDFEITTAAWFSVGYASSGTTQYRPVSFIAGASACESAISPAWALPDSTNCAACETFSPKTSRLET